jgi:hypothetical protein
VATAPFTGAAGFDELNELYSPFPGSRMAAVVGKFLDATKVFKAGNAEKLIGWLSDRAQAEGLAASIAGATVIESSGSGPRGQS